MAVVVVTAMGADKPASGASLQFLLDEFGRVLIVAARALNRFEVGDFGFQPVGDELGKHSAALAERADSVVPLQNRIADER